MAETRTMTWGVRREIRRGRLQGLARCLLGLSSPTRRIDITVIPLKSLQVEQRVSSDYISPNPKLQTPAWITRTPSSSTRQNVERLSKSLWQPNNLCWCIFWSKYLETGPYIHIRSNLQSSNFDIGVIRSFVLKLFWEDVKRPDIVDSIFPTKDHKNSDLVSRVYHSSQLEYSPAYWIPFINLITSE